VKPKSDDERLDSVDHEPRGSCDELLVLPREGPACIEGNVRREGEPPGRPNVSVMV
jgi:hypothetical protein